MSFALGWEGQTAIEAMHACDRLAPKLLELVEQHAHAAEVARPDWAGPHRDTFEDRYANVQQALLAGVSWVAQVRHDAATRLAQLTAEAEETARLLLTTGPR
ncbi:MAG: hypothetical protein QOD38_1402 [Acidimicrobiaceae bacterium]|jgi:hypothetical protein